MAIYVYQSMADLLGLGEVGLIRQKMVKCLRNLLEYYFGPNCQIMIWSASFCSITCYLKLILGVYHICSSGICPLDMLPIKQTACKLSRVSRKSLPKCQSMHDNLYQSTTNLLGLGDGRAVHLVVGVAAAVVHVAAARRLLDRHLWRPVGGGGGRPARGRRDGVKVVSNLQFMIKKFHQQYCG